MRELYSLSGQVDLSHRQNQIRQSCNGKSPSVASSFIGGLLRPVERDLQQRKRLRKRQEIAEQLNRMNEKLEMLQTSGKQKIFDQAQKIRAAQALQQISKNEGKAIPVGKQDSRVDDRDP